MPPESPATPHSSALRKGRFSLSGTAYFITSNTHQRRVYLTPPVREILIASLKWSRDDGRLWLLGYVVLDDHFHMLLTLRAANTLERVLNSIKRHAARQGNLLLRRQGEMWQTGFHDHAIRDEVDFWYHQRYMHENPVRRGWVQAPEDYVWSTAHASRQADVDWQAIGYG